MKKAKIYKPSKTAMQSGVKKFDKWVIEFITEKPGINPLMGWESSTDTSSELKLEFSSKDLAIEYAKKNINVNCISPGFIQTAMTDKIDEKFKEIIISKIPAARMGEPEDVANAVLFLASDQSNYINGETLHVNGGMYMA